MDYQSICRGYAGVVDYRSICRGYGAILDYRSIWRSYDGIMYQWLVPGGYDRDLYDFVLSKGRLCSYNLESPLVHILSAAYCIICHNLCVAAA
jgi:hypothetical protein